VFPPGVLEGAAGTYMTSAYFTPGSARSLAQLARRFPSVSIFDIDELLAQVRAVLDKAALAVESVFVFTLFAGLTVLLAAVQSSRDERRYESAMLRTLGASRATVVQGVLAEFATLGSLSGLIAAVGAAVGAYFLTTHWLDLRYTPELMPWVEGVVGGALLVAAGGWLATRSVVNQPPLTTLRGWGDSAARSACLPRSLARDTDRDPGVRLGLAAPADPFDGELIVAGTERGAVERNAQVAVGILAQVRDDLDPPLIDAIDRDTERVIRRARLVDLEV